MSHVYCKVLFKAQQSKQDCYVTFISSSEHITWVYMEGGVSFAAVHTKGWSLCREKQKT